MENALTTVLQSVQQLDNEAARSRAKTIYAICRSVTPQFYNKQTPDEMQAMINTIQLITQPIREDVLTMMCKLAVHAYPKEKANNPKTFFDLNYILGFYNKAWEKLRDEQGFVCFCGINEKKQICYTTDDGFDWERNCAKPNAPIWIDER